MTRLGPHEIDAAYDGVAAVVRDRLNRNLRIRRNLPGDGRVRIDRQLPFLCVYRVPAAGRDAGTRDLVTTEAAYLFASDAPEHAAGLQRLIAAIVELLSEHFGKFLLVEIWAEDDRPEATTPLDATKPGFCLVTQPCGEPSAAIAALQSGLQEVRSLGWPADVTTKTDSAPAPPRQQPLLAAPCNDCAVLGVAVRPVYRDAASGVLYPAVLNALRRQLATALRKGVFAFTGQLPSPQKHYESLGPSSMVKAARVVDQQLSEIAQTFDFVLQTAPLNSTSAWEDFQASGFSEAPAFYYRPLPYDPAHLKRQLFEAPIDRIEDSTLIHLFAQKQDHLDRQLTALKNIGTPAFYLDSLQLYGRPDEHLVQLARVILRRVDPTPGHHDGDVMRADELVAAARDEIDYYHQRSPAFVATVQVRDDLAASMMVAHDELLISSRAAIATHQVQPLLHHEVGTHLVTYFNGRQQPLQQLYAGLAGYEELQEGLAVLAEFVVGGLTPSRLRTIACRVLAVHAMSEGAKFVEVYHLLADEHDLPPRTSFMTALRAFRGGGLTKDAIYLRGLRELLEYLRNGHSVEPLYAGKIALEHVPLIQELRRRGIVGPPEQLPRFWDDAATAPRLEMCRQYSLLELVERLP